MANPSIRYIARLRGMHQSATSTALFPSPLWGGVRGGGRAVVHSDAFSITATPLPTLPHRKSGLPDLRTLTRNPGKPGLRGGGSAGAERVAYSSRHPEQMTS